MSSSHRLLLLFIIVIPDLDLVGIVEDIGDNVVLDLVALATCHFQDEVIERRPAENVYMVTCLSSALLPSHKQPSLRLTRIRTATR